MTLSSSLNRKAKALKFLPFAEAACGEHERRLLHDLLDNYNQLERPVGNESEPVVVSFGITLQQIIDVVGYPAAYSHFYNPPLHP